MSGAASEPGLRESCHRQQWKTDKMKKKKTRHSDWPIMVLSSLSICISYSCFLSDVSSLSCDSCWALMASVWCDATSATSFNRDTSTFSWDSDSSNDWTRRVTAACVSCVTESRIGKRKFQNREITGEKPRKNQKVTWWSMEINLNFFKVNFTLTGKLFP